MSILNVYPNATTSEIFLNNTKNLLQSMRETYNDMVINVESYNSESLCNQLYTIQENFFYNETNIWLNNISYSTALKLV